MGEADFAGPRLRAAADQRDVRDRVVRRAKRTIGQQPGPARQQARDGMDRGRLERFVERERRQDPGSRRAIIVFPAPGGPTSSRLCPPAEAISSARRASSCPRTSARSATAGARAGCGTIGAARQRSPDRSARGPHRPARRRQTRPDPRQSRLRAAFGDRQQDAGEAVAPGRGGDRQHAAGGVDRSVERQLAEQHADRRSRRRSTMPWAARMPSAIGRSNEAPALRTSAGARLTVTRCSGNSKPELRIALRTRSRLSRTLASGRPTIVKLRKSERDVHFHVDRTGLDAEDGGRPKAGEHGLRHLQRRGVRSSAPCLSRVGAIAADRRSARFCHAVDAAAMCRDCNEIGFDGTDNALC